MNAGEKIIKMGYSPNPIGCCGGHWFHLIAVNGGYTTECACGVWCGQWFKEQDKAIKYFIDMTRR